MLRIVCLQQGNYCGRGTEYVNVLYDAVSRNLAEGMAGVFECFTDQPEGLAPGIVARPLPAPGAPGWWGKLGLFRAGLWPEGDRVLLFDLDTLIEGAIEELATYAGPFAALEDFYRPGGLQSSVMAWPARFRPGRHTCWNGARTTADPSSVTTASSPRERMKTCSVACTLPTSVAPAGMVMVRA